jgi:alkylhydroperoxidase family enzyme
MARVTLVQKETAQPDVKDLFQKIENGGNRILNLHKAIGHSPKVTRDFIRLGNTLLFKAALPEKLRELAILRVAALTDAHYEWTQHVRVALRTGVPQAQIDAIRYWKSSASFNDQERIVLQFTDEETLNVHVSDETFTQAKQSLGEQAVVELTITIGYYGMVSRILETLQVELES